MSISLILAGTFAVVSLILTAIMKVWKFGPFLEEIEQETFNLNRHAPMTSTDNEIMPVIPSASPQQPPTASQPPEAVVITNQVETSPARANKPSVAEFCNAIALFEGGPGDANHLNSNPGNARFNYAGYLPMYGVVKCSPKGFAIFRDWNTGMLYLNNMVKNMIKHHPDETILQFMNRYAPSFENPTIAYANFIAKQLGITSSFLMRDLA